MSHLEEELSDDPQPIRWSADNERLEPITEFDVDSIKFDDEEPDPDETVVVAHASSALVRLLQWICEPLPNLKLAGARAASIQSLLSPTE